MCGNGLYKKVADCGTQIFQFTMKLNQATTLRIPLKPLLAIPRVMWRTFYHFNQLNKKFEIILHNYKGSLQFE